MEAAARRLARPEAAKKIVESCLELIHGKERNQEGHSALGDHMPLS